MRAAVDLCLRPRSASEASPMAVLLEEMGYRAVGVEGGEPGVYKAFTEAGLEVLRRITVKARSAAEAVKAVRRARQQYDLVAVEPHDAEAARFAARDERVDIVSLPPAMARYMDRSEAYLLRLGGGLVEARLSWLLTGQPRRVRALMVIARRAAAYDAPLAAVSCAKTRWQLWHPMAARAALALLGVPENTALAAVTAVPLSLVVRRLGGR